MVLILIAIVYAIVFGVTTERTNIGYLSIIENGVLTVIIAVVYGGLMCLMCLPILLNEDEGFRSNRIRVFLSWFLLPFGFMFLVIGKAINELLTVESTIEITYALLANAPFAIGLIVGYRKFVRNQQPN